MNIKGLKIELNSKIFLGWTFILGLFLRFYRIGFKSLWFDEAISLLESQKSLAMLLLDVNTEGMHPPLFRLLLHFWIHLGKSEFIVRIPALIFGVLSILVIYRIGELLFNRQVGLFAAFFLAVSPFQIHYSQEVRMYTFLLFLSLFSIYFFLKILKENKIILWLAYVFFTTLSLYCHYFALLNLFTQSAYFLLFYKRHKRLILRWISAQLTIFLLFSPWIPIFVKHLLRIKTNYWIPPVSIKTLFFTFKNFTLGYYTANLTIPFVLLLFFVLSLIGIMSFWGSHTKIIEDRACPWFQKEKLFFLLFYLFFPLALIFLISKIGRPIYLDRTLIGFSPMYYLLLATGIEKIRENNFFFPFIMIGIIMLSGGALKNYYLEQNFYPSVGVHPIQPVRELIKYIKINYQKGDVIALTHHSLFPSFEYYCPDSIRKQVYVVGVRDGDYMADYKSLGLKGFYNLKGLSDIRKITKEAKRVWLVCSNWGNTPIFIPPDVKKWLDEHEPALKSKSFCGIELYYIVP